MQIEIKPKGKVEYRGQSSNGRVLTIEKQGKGYMVRGYQVKCHDLLREPLDWEGAFKVFQAIFNRRERMFKKVPRSPGEGLGDRLIQQLLLEGILVQFVGKNVLMEAK